MSAQTDCEMLSIEVMKQVSFHTEKALQYVQLVRRVSYARKDI